MHRIGLTLCNLCYDTTCRAIAVNAGGDQATVLNLLVRLMKISDDATGIDSPSGGTASTVDAPLLHTRKASRSASPAAQVEPLETSVPRQRRPLSIGALKHQDSRFGRSGRLLDSPASVRSPRSPSGSRWRAQPAEWSEPQPYCGVAVQRDSAERPEEQHQLIMEIRNTAARIACKLAKDLPNHSRLVQCHIPSGFIAMTKDKECPPPLQEACYAVSCCNALLGCPARLLTSRVVHHSPSANCQLAPRSSIDRRLGRALLAPS